MADTLMADKRVRTRFAPSPTGSPHVGTLRTGLFSFLLARHFGGDFLLRIEDTDQARTVPGALEEILRSFRALGIAYDEGPDRASVAALDRERYGPVDPDLLPENGGPFGPYFQSQRLTRYRESPSGSWTRAGPTMHSTRPKSSTPAARRRRPGGRRSCTTDATAAFPWTSSGRGPPAASAT
jgi:glutamyl-tRNA synthetase